MKREAPGRIRAKGVLHIKLLQALGRISAETLASAGDGLTAGVLTFWSLVMGTYLLSCHWVAVET